MLTRDAHFTVGDGATCAPCRTVLMVGTHQTTMGGISTVVRGYEEGGLFDRFPVRYITSHRDGTGWVKARTAIGGWLTFARELMRRRAPLVHIHLSSRASFWRKSVFCLMAELSGRPYLLHVHGSEFMRFHDRECSPRARRFIARTFRKSALVLALSEQWRADLLRICPEARIEVLQNAVALPDLNARAPAPDGSLRIVFLGRLGERKGTPVLLEAFSRVARDRPNLRLVCGGDGDIDGTLRQAQRLGLADKVRCTGWLSPQEASRQLSQASIFALPSHAEGLPMALLEAMSWALPVITTPVGGIPQVVSQGENGLLVQPGDTDSLAAALARLCDDARLRETLGAAARSTIEQRFSLPAAIERLGRVYATFGLKARPGARLTGA